MKIKNLKLNEIIIFCFPMIILLILCMYNFRDNLSIKIVGDEYGYWASGAYFAGLDWSEITSYNSYYSFGYGLWLALILKLNLSALVSYKIALVLNAIFLCGIYIIVNKLIKEYCKEISFIFRIGISFAVTIYTSNLYYTQYTMSEVLIALLYWCIIYCSCKLLEKVTVRRVLIYVFLLIYLFIVHQRTIGVCFVSLLFLIYVLVRNQTHPKWILLLGIVAIGIIGVFISMKTGYQDAFFKGGQGINLSGNDFSGQTSKLQYVLTPNGMWMFIKAYVGKIFYALSSTDLLAGVAVIIVFIELIQCIRNRALMNRKSNNSIVLMCYLILNTAAMMAVGSVFMANYYSRYDVIIYGRYFDFTLSPLILIALVYMMLRNNKILYFCMPVLIVSYVVMAILINHTMVYQTDFSNLFINCPGVADTILYLNCRKNALLFVALKEVITFLIFIYVYCFIKKNAIYKLIAIICYASVSICCDQYVYENGCLSWSLSQNLEEIELLDYIKSENIEKQLYYYIGDSVVNADYLQFLLKDHTIKVISDIEKLDNKGYILTSKRSKISLELENLGYQIIESSKVLDLWKK